jgi:hypothetical protein
MLVRAGTCLYMLVRAGTRTFQLIMEKVVFYLTLALFSLTFVSIQALPAWIFSERAGVARLHSVLFLARPGAAVELEG